jgi:DNA-binding NtrC family response regulator
MQENAMALATGGNGARPGLKALLEEYERTLIREALEASGGHQRRTAARLGLLPTTLHEKMKRLGLLQPRERTVSFGGTDGVSRPGSLTAAFGRR